MMKLAGLVLALSACSVAASPRLMTRRLTGENVVDQFLSDAQPRVPNPNKAAQAAGAAAAYAANAAYAIKNLPRTLSINRTAQACGSAVKALDDYFKSIYPLASKPVKECIALKSPANSFRFFYDNAPKELIERVGGQPADMPQAAKSDQPTDEYNFDPPKLFEPYSVFGNDNCTFYINQYPPKAWWEFENAAGVPSGYAVEVMHVKAGAGEARRAANPSASFNAATELGFFYYYSPGSGIYFTIGSTIVAHNKLALLSDLGVSWDAMAAAVFAPNVKFFPGQANQGNTAPTTDFRSFMTPSAAAFTNAQLLEIGAFGTDDNLPSGFDNDDLYMANRLANNFAADALVAPLLKAALISTLQLTVQPNSDGGWAYEIVQYVPTAVAPSITTYGQYMAFIEASLSTRDPCRGEYEVEPPMVPAAAGLLNPAGTCTFDVTNYKCIYCQNQDVKTVCCTNRPPGQINK